MKVAIQGGVASFHDIAARRFFKQDLDLICCKTFRELCEVLTSGKADYAAMAIENSIAGSILGNYALMREYKLRIIGEIHLRIEQNLMALPGTRLEEVQIVRSHYMALNQCEEFLLKHPYLTLQEYYDTADSAKDLARDVPAQGKKIAAIASRYAAEVYGLDLLAESIETVKENYTRFFILTRDRKVKVEQPTKATLCFQLPDRIGALTEVLKVIVENRLNLTKIQSLPILGKPSEYTFYVDCEWSSYEHFKRSIVINSLVNDLVILGEYKKGEVIHDYTRS